MSKQKKSVSRRCPNVNIFDGFMWDGYSGADVSDWPHGDPVYCAIGQYLIIADSKCVNATRSDEPDVWWDLDIQFPCQKAAIAFLLGLRPDWFEPADYGFKRSDEPRESPEAKTDDTVRMTKQLGRLIRTLKEFFDNLEDTARAFKATMISQALKMEVSQ